MKKEAKTMKASVLLSILVLSALLLAACGPTVDEAKTQFCNDLDELDVEVNSLRDVDSLDDIKQAGEDIRDAWDQVVKSAEKLDDVQLDATKEAYDAMLSAIEGAPDSGSLSGALETVTGAVTTFATSFKEIYTTTCGAQ
jgi:predicted small secreted protein